MTDAGIEIIDTDSMDAAADLMDDVEGFVMTEREIAAARAERAANTAWQTMRDAYADYVETLANDLASDDIHPDGDDGEPAPPTPVAPALAVALPVCPACEGAGAWPRYLDSPCWYCDGSGRDGVAAVLPAVSVPFDRAAHCRRIATSSGIATVRTRGVARRRAIGTAGARVTIARHGVACWRGIVTAKGWDRTRRPDLLSDLAAGHVLADLDCAA